MTEIKNIDKVLTILEQVDFDLYSDEKGKRFSARTCYKFIDKLAEVLDWDVDDIEWHHGASKMVIMFPELDDWCIKLPFTYYEMEGDENNSHVFDYDHCELEVEAYNNAVIDGFDEVFAEELLVGYIHGSFPVYAQRLIIPATSDTADYVTEESVRSFYDEMETIEEDYVQYATDDDWWNTAVCLYFGWCRGIEILKYIYEHCDDMNDGGVGYSFDGKPMLCDYGGYRC